MYPEVLVHTVLRVSGITIIRSQGSHSIWLRVQGASLQLTECQGAVPLARLRIWFVEHGTQLRAAVPWRAQPTPTVTGDYQIPDGECKGVGSAGV